MSLRMMVWTGMDMYIILTHVWKTMVQLNAKSISPYTAVESRLMEHMAGIGLPKWVIMSMQPQITSLLFTQWFNLICNSLNSLASTSWLKLTERTICSKMESNNRHLSI